MREYDEADAQTWAEAPPRDGVDEWAREVDPFYRDEETVDTDEGDDLEEAQDEGIWYRWLCPHCTEVNESENDTRGERVVCSHCLGEARHRG